MVKYFSKDQGTVSGEENIMREIMEYGPVACPMADTDEFSYDYTHGVFEDKTGKTEINHMVEVVGWGVDKDSGKKYWHVRNSWGTYWGMNGFFKIIRGVNNVMIESECYWMSPDISMETLVLGDNPVLVGDMYGLMDNPDTQESSFQQSLQGSLAEDNGNAGNSTISQWVSYVVVGGVGILVGFLVSLFTRRNQQGIPNRAGPYDIIN
uniref:Peptidase C1A papain C-terminal domain-containing protein n=1 Tax=Fibrocapsa japonica TaxID=94617 RepID=A0A7S2V9Q1_9STRA